jgi:hypothetical protein
MLFTAARRSCGKTAIEKPITRVSPKHWSLFAWNETFVSSQITDSTSLTPLWSEACNPTNLNCRLCPGCIVVVPGHEKEITQSQLVPAIDASAEPK